MIIVRPINYVDSYGRNNIHKELVEMAREGILVLPNNYELLYSDERDLESHKNIKVGFTD